MTPTSMIETMDEYLLTTILQAEKIKLQDGDLEKYYQNLYDIYSKGMHQLFGAYTFYLSTKKGETREPKEIGNQLKKERAVV